VSRFNSFARSGIARGLSFLPVTLLRRFEEQLQLAQGKGGGTASLAQEVRAGLSLLPASRRTKPVVFDIGANVGEWSSTLLEIEPDASVVCFEPSQVASEILSERFSRISNVRIVQIGIGKQRETTQLWADRAGSGLGSLSRRRLDHFGIDFSFTEKVEVTTLDEWTGINDIYPDLLKLDIEGHELDALNGSTETLEHVSVVQFEFGGCNIDTRTYLQDFFYFFTERNFRIFRLGPNGVLPIRRYSERDEVFITSNFFAVSESVRS